MVQVVLTSNYEALNAIPLLLKKEEENVIFCQACINFACIS
jgi:hypothetical protein